MKRIIVIAGIVLFLLVAGGLVVFGSPGAAKADSGVTACQDMADRQASGKKSSGTMTEADYVAAMAPFKNSGHQDLQIAGVNFVHSVYLSQQALETDDTPLMTSFGVLTEIKAKYASLQIACANHGVKLNPLTT